MNGSITHFEIYGDRAAELAVFYQRVLGWQVEQMPGVDYWRVQPGQAEQPMHGGITYRSLPGVSGWMFYVKIRSVEQTTALIKELGGDVVRPKTAVPRTAWVAIVSDPQKNVFGIWEADANAFPMPEPD